MLERQQQVNGKTIRVKQDLSLSHAGTVWDGALVLTYFLENNQAAIQKYLKNKKVLQLGSGTGFLGLACTAFGPKQMILTDLPQFVCILQQNIGLNMDKNSKKVNQCITQGAALSWGNLQHINHFQNIQTVIGSQLAYDKQYIALLIKTLSLLYQKNNDLKIIISYQKYENPEKNLAIQLKEQFKYKQFKQIAFGDMNQTYRDDYIGILYID